MIVSNASHRTTASSTAPPTPVAQRTLLKLLATAAAGEAPRPPVSCCVSFDRVTRTCGAALFALAGFVVAPAGAQSAPDSEPRARGRLFDSAEPLALTLTADFGAIGKNRRGDKPDHPGVLSYVTPAGDSVSIPVQLRTRGHYRLATCQYPPLKVTFDRERSAHTPFSHQGSLKLTVQCRGGRTYANYVLEEYLLYHTYNLLTDRSFRA